MNPILVLLIVFVVTLILGVPFAWSLLLASAASVCMIDGLPLMQIASKMYNGGAKYTLLLSMRSLKRKTSVFIRAYLLPWMKIPRVITK